MEELEAVAPHACCFTSAEGVASSGVAFADLNSKRLIWVQVLSQFECSSVNAKWLLQVAIAILEILADKVKENKPCTVDSYSIIIL
jgi:hypothetical protein